MHSFPSCLSLGASDLLSVHECDVESGENIVVDSDTTCLPGSQSAQCHFDTPESFWTFSFLSFFSFEKGDNCVLKTCLREQNFSFIDIVYICAKLVDNIFRNMW